MVAEMQKVAKDDREMSVEERNLLSVAFKNVISVKRSSWRVLASEEEKQKEKSDEIREKQIKKYKSQIEKEIKDFCSDVIGILEKKQNSSSIESTVFYVKMLADYHRYQAEVSVGSDRQKGAARCLEAYKDATVSASQLHPTNPVRLGLALNFSVFYYEIINQPQKACQHAKAAFDGAIAELDTLDEDIYKDATLIIQLLRDNLTLWTSDMPDENDMGETEDTEQSQQEAN